MTTHTLRRFPLVSFSTPSLVSFFVFLFLFFFGLHPDQPLFPLSADPLEDGIRYYKQKKLKRAEKALVEAMRSNKQGSRNWVKAFFYLADVYKFSGQWTKALKFHEIMEKFLKKANPKQLPIVYRSLGVIHRNLGSPNKALDYYNKSIRIDQKSGNTVGVARATLNSALIYLNQSNYKVARKLLLKAQPVFEKRGLAKELSMIFNNLGLIARREENWPLAESLYKKSLKIKEVSTPRFIVQPQCTES